MSDLLRNHLGHRVEIAAYGPTGDPVSVTLECLDCGCVLHEDAPDGNEQAPASPVALVEVEGGLVQDSTVTGDTILIVIDWDTLEDSDDFLLDGINTILERLDTLPVDQAHLADAPLARIGDTLTRRKITTPCLECGDDTPAARTDWRYCPSHTPVSETQTARVGA